MTPTPHRFYPAVLLAALGLLTAAAAATPPALLNYQGVLRDIADNPLTGSYDMTFRLFDASAAGNEILIDVHDTANSNAVSVDNGLFNVAIGGGIVSDGSGPGSYVNLGEVFRDHSSVW